MNTTDGITMQPASETHSRIERPSTLDHLSNIARCLRCVGSTMGVHLARHGDSDSSLVEKLAELPGALRSATIYRSLPPKKPEPEYVLENVRVLVDGIEFSAQLNRPATPDEIAALDEHGYNDAPACFRAWRLVG